MLVPNAKYMPDQSDHKSGSSRNNLNVVPLGGPGGYGPIKAPQAYSVNGLDARCQGAFSALDIDGIPHLFAGDETKLYELQGSATFADVSGATYATPPDGSWEFVQFGENVLATNVIDPIQRFILGSSTDFADLAGTPPNARYLTSVRDFVVLGNLSTDPQAVAWCDDNDITNWSTGLADQQTLPEGGWIMNLTGGQNGLIFKETSIYRMLFVGDSQIVFQFDEVERGRGLYVSDGIAQVGERIFYISPDGFYMCSSGGGDSVPIGSKRVDRTFFDSLDESKKMFMTAGADPRNKIVYWSYCSTSAPTTVCDKLLLYNWDADEWAIASVDAEHLVNSRSQGYTLESLDGLGYTLDTLPFSLDSRAWTSGSLQLGLFDEDHMLDLLTGDNLEATAETQESDIADGRRAMVTNIRPIVDVADVTDVTVSAGVKERLAGTTSYVAAGAMRDNGDCPIRASGRYFRSKTVIAAGADWSHMQGIEFDAVTDGER